MCFVIICASLIKIRLLGMPLERDEGEYAYIAQLFLHKAPLYINAYSMKLPGIYFIYAIVIKLFGHSIQSIHLGLTVITGITGVLVFVLAKRLFNPITGVVAGISYMLLTMGKYTLAFNIEHAVMLFVVGGTILLMEPAGGSRRLFISGLMFGLAFITKQHAIFFIAFASAYIVWGHLKAHASSYAPCVNRLRIFLSGAVLPFILVCIFLAWQGVFNVFWFWAFTYSAKYCGIIKFKDGIENLFYTANKIIGCSPLIWLAGAFGIVVMKLDSSTRSNMVIVSGFVIASILAVVPGLYFRHHYFIFIFPALAILAGRAVHYAWQRLSASPLSGGYRKSIMATLFILLFGISIFHQRKFLFKMDTAEAVNDIYITSPIVETMEIAKYIEKHSDSSKSVVVFGSEPQIFYYLNRFSPISYIYVYPLMEETRYVLNLQKNFIKQVESANADYLVYVNVSTSWFNRYINKAIAYPLFEWMHAYQKRYYDIVGVIDMISRNNSVYVWDSEVIKYRPKSDSFIYVLKRKE